MFEKFSVFEKFHMMLYVFFWYILPTLALVVLLVFPIYWFFLRNKKAPASAGQALFISLFGIACLIWMPTIIPWIYKKYDRYRALTVLPSNQVINGLDLPKGTKLLSEAEDGYDVNKFWFMNYAPGADPLTWNRIEVSSVVVDKIFAVPLKEQNRVLPYGTYLEIRGYDTGRGTRSREAYYSCEFDEYRFKRKADAPNDHSLAEKNYEFHSCIRE
jgi:hypothetical protein